MLVETQHEKPARIAPGGQFQFVAVAQLPLRPNAGGNQLFGAFARDAADARELAYHVGALRLELRLVAKMHPRAAAADAGIGASRLNAQRACFHDPIHNRFAKALRLACDFDVHHIARSGSCDEDHFAVVGASNGVGAVRHAGDRSAHAEPSFWFSWGNRDEANHNV